MELRTAIADLLNSISLQKTEYGMAEVEVEASGVQCTICGAMMTVQKTVRRTAATLAHGLFHTRERVLACPYGCHHADGSAVIARSPEISSLLPQKAKYGYDIEVSVGLERFMCHRQREEIRKQIQESCPAQISSGEISVLANRFQLHLAALHRSRAGKICDAHRCDGGYTMHIDATTEGGKGMLLVIFSGWKRWVLGAWKIQSESAESIEPCITEICMLFGEPCAIVSDLGPAMRTAIINAISKMSSKPYVFACHYHFLSDIGKDILNENHELLRKRARSSLIKKKIRALVQNLKKDISQNDVNDVRRYFERWDSGKSFINMPDGSSGVTLVVTLAQWILDHPHDGNNMGFPFDRPYYSLYNRCCKAREVIYYFKTQQCFDNKVNRAMDKLIDEIILFVMDKDVKKTVRALEARMALFDRFRALFRLDGVLLEAIVIEGNAEASVSDSRRALEYERQSKDMCNKVNVFSENLQKRYNSYRTNKDMRAAIKIIIDHLEKHGDYLWAHLLKLQLPNGEMVYKLVDRTNNILENFFHQMKHHERRRCGRKELTMDFERIQPGAAIAMNLHDPAYVREVFGSIDQLPSLFSEIDQEIQHVLHQKRNYTIAEPLPAGSDDLVLENLRKSFIRTQKYQDWIQSASRTSDFSTSLPLANDNFAPFDNINEFIEMSENM